MSITTLPAAEIQYPACGACLSETSHDGDGYVCEPCGLQFDHADGLKASYLDEAASPCAQPCDNSWHNATERSHYECAPCHLPADHESDHDTPCRIVLNKESGGSAS